MDNNMAATADLESVRKIHRTLIEAVKTAESAVHAQLAQRRFWLEEICSNLDEEGGLQATSIWKRPIHVKTPLAKKSTTKTAGLKRKKTSLESSETKPAKNPRKKKSGAEGTDKKPQPKKNPTVKIKMRASSLSSDRVASSPDTADTESQKHDDEDSTGEYRVDLGSYHSRHPSADQNSDWDSTANNPLEMMVSLSIYRHYHLIKKQSNNRYFLLRQRSHMGRTELPTFLKHMFMKANL